MTMRSLVRHWWMMAIRGVLAIAFGVTVLMWPDMTLSLIVVMFGVYALADGAWAIAAGVRASTQVVDAWPVVAQGVVSVALGLVALLWPSVPRNVLYVVVVGGLLTGVLELMVAAGVPRAQPGRWLLLAGGGASLFLALLVLVLPYAGMDLVALLIAAYAQVFGVGLLLFAVDFAGRHGPEAGLRERP